MDTSKARKNGITLLVLSLLLTVFTVLQILGPSLPTGVSTFTIQSLIVFVSSCIGLTLGILGIRQAKRAGISCSLIVLGGLSLLIHGSNILIPYGWLNPPEVKGVVQRIDASFISINVDEDYLPEYDTAHLPDGLATDLDAGISSRTTFYQQYGNWWWQKKVVTIGNVYEGQHVQIQYNGMRWLTGDIIEAGQIVILNQ